MLHELLLVLSAHDSSIFKPWPPPPSQPTTILLDSTLTNIHPSERAALNSLAHLSFLHKDLLSATAHLTHSHASIVVRAILSSARDTLNAFQRRLEEIERMILTRDDSVVGAYDIVPLARITTLLGEWDRIIGYLHKFVMAVKLESTGAHVLERLCRDIHSGYADLALLVQKLLVAGEEAWLRQVSSWVLYGRIPQLGQSDFFIRAASEGTVSALDENAFVVEWTLWPVHLPRETASSILFIGRALARIQMQSSTYRPSTTHQILKTHLAHLNSLTFPLHPIAFSKAITAIRLSLSSSVLSTLLPLDTIITLVKRFRQDFLLGHGSLMLTLLTTAEEYLVRRNDRDGGTIKDSEVNALLTKSFAIISRLEASEADEEDPSRQKYEQALNLGLVKAPVKTEGVTFDEFLLGGERVELRYEIQWPLDLFLSRADVETYNRIFLFLLAVKQTQGRLTSLWPGRNVPFVGRGTWSAIHYALFFINSLWNYFQANVIELQFGELLADMEKSTLSEEKTSGYDPESLRDAHTRYLDSLLEGLFLSPSSTALSRLLKKLLLLMDELVDLIAREEEVEGVRIRGVKAVVDECVRELEGIAEKEGGGWVEKLLLGLDGGQWFTENLHDGSDDGDV